MLYTFKNILGKSKKYKKRQGHTTHTKRRSKIRYNNINHDKNKKKIRTTEIETKVTKPLNFSFANLFIFAFIKTI